MIGLRLRLPAAGRAVLAGALLLTVLPSGCARPADPGLDGLWSGTLEHAGHESGFALRFDVTEPGSVTVALSMPAIGVFDLPFGTGTFDGRTLRVGNWSCEYDAEADTVSGTVPASLLPVYDVPFILHRADRLEVPAPPPDPPSMPPSWTVDTGAPVWAGVAASDGVVYVGNDDGAITAIREADRAVLWTRRAGGAIRATPAVAAGSVYVHADDGVVYCLDTGDGTERWRARVDRAVERIPPGQAGSRYDSYSSSVLLVDGTAYVGTAGGSLVALNAADGSERWRHEAGEAILGTPSVGGGRVYYADFSGRVAALEAQAGEVLWSTPTAGAIVSSPALAGDVLVVGNRAYDLLALSAADGSVAWTYYYWFSWVESSATIRDGVAYVGSSDGQRLHAFDAATGRLQWSAPTGGSTWAQPAVDDTRVYVGTVGVADYIVAHRGHFLAVDRATGQPAWRFTTERAGEAATWGFASSPTVGQRAVYAGGLDGRLYAFPRD
jgi:outer membrane protein assembly factor BamB